LGIFDPESHDKLDAPIGVNHLGPTAGASGPLPVLRVEWHASASEIGWVVAAYQAGYVVGVLVLLPLTDVQRPARVVTGSVLVTACQCHRCRSPLPGRPAAISL